MESTNRELLSRVTGLSEAHQKVDVGTIKYSPADHQFG